MSNLLDAADGMDGVLKEREGKSCANARSIGVGSMFLDVNVGRTQVGGGGEGTEKVSWFDAAVGRALLDSVFETVSLEILGREPGKLWLLNTADFGHGDGAIDGEVKTSGQLSTYVVIGFVIGLFTNVGSEAGAAANSLLRSPITAVFLGATAKYAADVDSRVPGRKGSGWANRGKTGLRPAKWEYGNCGILCDMYMGSFTFSARASLFVSAIVAVLPE